MNKHEIKFCDKNKTLKEIKDIVGRVRNDLSLDYKDNPRELATAIDIEASEVLENFLFKDLSEVDMTEVKGEIGDVLVYVIALCIERDWELSEVIAQTLEKLINRHMKGVE